MDPEITKQILKELAEAKQKMQECEDFVNAMQVNVNRIRDWLILATPDSLHGSDVKNTDSQINRED